MEEWLRSYNLLPLPHFVEKETDQKEAYPPILYRSQWQAGKGVARTADSWSDVCVCLHIQVYTWYVHMHAHARVCTCICCLHFSPAKDYTSGNAWGQTGSMRHSPEVLRYGWMPSLPNQRLGWTCLLTLRKGRPTAQDKKKKRSGAKWSQSSPLREIYWQGV